MVVSTQRLKCTNQTTNKNVHIHDLSGMSHSVYRDTCSTNFHVLLRNFIHTTITQ